MDERFASAILWLVIALLLSAASSLVGHFVILDSLTEWFQGFFDGLCVIACGASIVLLVRARRRA